MSESPSAAPRRVRVLVLGHTAELGGAELALVRLLAAVDRTAYDVQVVLFADGPLVARLAAVGVDVAVIPLDDRLVGAARHDSAARAWLALPRLGGFGRALVRHIRRMQPDVLMSTTLKAHLVAAGVAPLVRVPLVWQLHDRIAADYLPERRVRLLRALARHSPRVVLSNSVATGATVPGVRRIVVAWPGLTPAQRRDEPRPLPSGDQPLVGLLGRISPTKGQREFVAAAAIVHAARPQARFRIVGAALFGAQGYAAELASDVRRLGLSDVVTMVGQVDDVAMELDGLTLLVHASPVAEPFGQVVAEAMARGVPVVATNAGGIPEILAPGETLGLLVPPGDVQALGAAITAVLDDPAAAQERAARAWASATERFAVERTAQTVSAVWSQVAQESARARRHRSARMPLRLPPS